MKLTPANYFTATNQYITSSKLKDWGEDKRVFYEKHVLHCFKKKYNPSLAYGSIMDNILSGRSSYNKMFPEKIVKEVTEYAKVAMESDEFKQVMADKPKSQKILIYEQKTGIFEGLAGIPDWYIIKNGKCLITDLKTTAARDEIEYYDHCDKYKYYLQQAFYQLIIELTADKPLTFVSQHLIIYKNHKGKRVDLIPLNQNRIEREKIKIRQYLEEIRTEFKFGRYENVWNF